MKHNLNSTASISRALRFLSFSSAATLILCGTLVRAALPADPIVELTFPEGPAGTGGNGVITTNTGTLSGYMTFALDLANLWETNTLPVFTNLVPTGTYVPAGNAYSVDMGTISGVCAGGNGGRGIDSSPSFSTIGACNQLTVCGWVNANSLPGARTVELVYAFESPFFSGFGLQENLDGTLSFLANGGEITPASSTVKLTASSSYATNNWIFFAVTYNPTLSTDQLKYYFGRPDKLAVLDVATTYVPTSAIGSNIDYTGPLTVGNASTVDGIRLETGSCSRMFRGLIDEVKIYTNALTLDQVQEAQLNQPVPATAAYFIQQPANATAPVGASATFTCEANGSGEVTYQWRTNGVAVTGATSSSFTWNNVQLAENGTIVSVVIANPALPGGLASANVTLTVIPAEPKIVSFSFSGTSGVLTPNEGAFEGAGKLNIQGGLPIIIGTNLPSGSQTPNAAYNVDSLYMGLVAAGNRAVDMTNNLVSTVGNLSSMKALTICGWLNSANDTFRTTSTGRGNAVVNASLGGANGGFVLGYRPNTGSSAANYGESGRLVLQVNEWLTSDNVTAAQMSSVDTIPIGDTNCAPENWIFFAVTYDGTLTENNINYYFGNATNPAAADPISPQTYDKGVIAQTGPLSIGNHNTSTGNPTGRGVSNTNGTQWRGLMDEIKIYNKVLTLAEIQEAQKSPALPLYLKAETQTNNIVLSWEGPAQLQSRTDLSTGTWSDVTNPTNVSGTIRSLGLPIVGDTKFFRVK